MAHHLFCRVCGVHPFERIEMPNMTGWRYLNISVACLDGLDVEELLTAPVTYCDGRGNDWASRPDEVRHL